MRTEYLVDAEKAFHVLRGAMLLADGQLERIREDADARDQQSREANPAGGVSGEALELFAQLLESAYAEPGTLRPALVCGGKLLKKGMAAR